MEAERKINLMMASKAEGSDGNNESGRERKTLA
jgi:hypothetical protein